MKAWPALEYSEREFANPPWAIPNLVPAHGIILVYAFPKVGKSILCMQLAHALGTGTSFLGYLPDRPWKPLYVQSDLPEGEWAHQMKLIDRREGWFTTWESPGWINNPARVEELKKLIHEGEYSFIIYDSLLTVTGYADLDSEVVIGRHLTVLRSVADLPSIVIHHKRKGFPGVPDHSSVSAAGSYALSAGVSTLFDLTDHGLAVRGRYTKLELPLSRDNEGRWQVKSKKELYSFSPA